MNTVEPSHVKPIRSFVRREGRMSPGLKRDFAAYWPLYGVDLPLKTAQPFDVTRFFPNPDAPCILEIGFGKGCSLLTMAQNAPEMNFLGIEVYRTGVAHVLHGIVALGLKNLRVACCDSVELLQQIPDASLSGLQLFFPDPWPKKRHHKRRLIQTEFVNLMACKLKPGAVFHMATDWQPYALHALDCLMANLQFTNCDPQGGFSPRPLARPETPFEKRGKRLGHGIYDLLFQRLY